MHCGINRDQVEGYKKYQRKRREGGFQSSRPDTSAGYVMTSADWERLEAEEEAGKPFYYDSISRQMYEIGLLSDDLIDKMELRNRNIRSIGSADNLGICDQLLRIEKLNLKTYALLIPSFNTYHRYIISTDNVGRILSFTWRHSE